MMQWYLVILFIHLNLFKQFYAFPGGAPESTCELMIPSHGGTNSQSSQSPYQLLAKNSGDLVEVTIQSAGSGTPLRGFVIKAFQGDGSDINGEFNSDTTITKSLKCLDGENSALTHNSRDNKSIIKATWKPLQSVNGEVFFRATVVQNYVTFWTGVESSKVSVTHANDGRKTTQQLSTPESSLSKDLIIYSGCGNSKGCFGQPDGCIDSKSCTVIVSFRREAQSFKFEMVGAMGSKDNWIAMGLSRDSKMGNDSVTECVYFNGEVQIRESWNVDTPRKGNNLLQASNVQSEQNQYEDGAISCSWSLPGNFEANNEFFDLANETYYIIMAKGPVESRGGKIYHSKTWVTEQKVNFTSVSLLEARKRTLVKLHGIIMTVTWIALVSTAILVARHYKEVWSKRKPCGVKMWFAIHRSCMVMSVILMVIAFVVIFIEVGGWSQVDLNPHPILGVISTVLGVSQPFIAMLRCHPDHPKRPVFKWTHTLVGNAGHLIAIVNMFFAVGLNSAQLPKAFTWVLTTFVVFYCATHLLIQLHTHLMEKARKRGAVQSHANHLQLADSYTVNQVEGDGAGSAFKKFILSLFCVVTVGITVALVLMIALN